MGSGGIPQRETCLAVCLWQWYPSAKRGFAEMKKAGMNPAFVCLRDYLEEKLPK